MTDPEETVEMVVRMTGDSIAVDTLGRETSLVEVLGILELAKSSVIEQAFGAVTR